MSQDSPLASRHVGATLTDFGGWRMPVSYASAVEEHRAVRTTVGLFDVSHLGKVWVRGDAALPALNRLLTNDLTKVGDGQAQYHLVCNDAGGVIDDLMAYRFSASEILLMPNAANSAAVVSRLATALPSGVSLVDAHHDLAVLAIQGPQSVAVMTALELPHDRDYLTAGRVTWRGVELIICRSGYTGELGYELLVPVAAAESVWDSVLAEVTRLGGLAVGLGARDTLRTEMGYPLHGHELAPEVLATDCGVSWAIAWDKPEFWGREALLAARAVGAAHTSVALQAAGRWIPRAGMAVVDADGVEVGVITSGTFSPTLACGIALARVSTDWRRAHKFGADVWVQNRARRDAFTLVKAPFVESHVR